MTATPLRSDTLRLTLESMALQRTAQPNRAQVLKPNERSAVLDHVYLLHGLLRSIMQVGMTGQEIPGLWEAVRAAVPPLDEPVPPPKAPRTFHQHMADIRAELEAIENVAIHAHRLRVTAPVDDDFPAVKHGYDGAVEALVQALRANERLP